MAIKTLITGEELLRMPDGGKRYELVRGELIVMSPPGGEHGKRATRISRLFDEFVEKRDLGTVCVESGFYLERNPDTVRGPDVLFIGKEKLDPSIVVEGYFEVIPDLIVEVVSPGDTHSEVAERVDEYLRAGVRLVFVVDMRRRTVTSYPGAQTLKEGDTITFGDVLPGLEVPVSRIFK